MSLEEEVSDLIINHDYSVDGVHSLTPTIIALVLDKVKALTFETPEYIANSQEHLRGYNKALDNMNLAIEKMRERDDE